MIHIILLSRKERGRKLDLPGMGSRSNQTAVAMRRKRLKWWLQHYLLSYNQARCIHPTFVECYAVEAFYIAIASDFYSKLKILTAQIREEIYYSLTSRRLFPNEQKGCCKGSRGTAELLYIDQYKWKQEQTEKSNYGVGRLQKGIGYGSAKLDNKLSQNVHNITWSHKLHRKKTWKNWRVELTAGGKSLAETKIQRGIFQGNALTLLLFLIAMMPLNHTLRKCTAGYKLSRSQEKINHIMYMDDIKLLAKNEKELGTLIHTVRI